MAIGFTLEAVKHKVARGRLHPVHRGVYAVGRRALTRQGECMAAVLACGEHAALSHNSAAALWGLLHERSRTIHVSVDRRSDPRHDGIAVHRAPGAGPQRADAPRDVPVTTPLRTLIDLATRVPSFALETAMNEADKLDLIDHLSIRAALEDRPGQRGVRPLRDILDRGEFVLTDSELERRFLPIARRAGLPKPLTQQHVNGFRVDFYWPDLCLVVETDGLRYHRSPSQQARDRVRDQAHIAAGLTPLRFTHWQVRYDSGHVERTLRSTIAMRTRWRGAGGPLAR